MQFTKIIFRFIMVNLNVIYGNNIQDDCVYMKVFRQCNSKPQDDSIMTTLMLFCLNSNCSMPTNDRWLVRDGHSALLYQIQSNLIKIT